MSRFDEPLPIFVDDKGRPYPGRPERPPPGVSLDERLAYVDAKQRYLDAATERANRAFDEAFRRALKR